MQTWTPFSLELLRGKYHRIFGVWRTNQRAPLTLSTVLVYTNKRYSLLISNSKIYGKRASIQRDRVIANIFWQSRGPLLNRGATHDSRIKTTTNVQNTWNRLWCPNCYIVLVPSLIDQICNNNPMNINDKTTFLKWHFGEVGYLLEFLHCLQQTEDEPLIQTLLPHC